MAITRRQFVTRMGALAAAVGMSQTQISSLSNAFASYGGGAKPKVVWLHGAECTGCSVSLLSFFEKLDGNIYGTPHTTLDALGLAGYDGLNDLPTHGALSAIRDGGATPLAADVADLLVDLIDLQYHETVMGMGGDLAARWLEEVSTNAPGGFVLVVEGAVQDAANGGAWGDTSSQTHGAHEDQFWCKVGMTSDGSYSAEFSGLVEALGAQAAAVVAIGQCASYGGYPGCKPNMTSKEAGFDVLQSQTGATGVAPFLAAKGVSTPVVNVPGCPANPWWFVLTVVGYLIETQDPGFLLNNIDGAGRFSLAYPTTVHSSKCSRYEYFARGEMAKKPGDRGCLQNLGCKGTSTSSLCSVHGWNNNQPENGAYGVNPVNGKVGNCTRAGAPCMGCTEPGYPDSFVPFVKRV